MRKIKEDDIKTMQVKIMFILFALFTCFYTAKIFAQLKKTQPVYKSKLYGVARPGKKEILIRWAPADERAWNLGNKYGYVLERYTTVREGKVLNKFEKSMAPLIIKPIPLNMWDSIANNDDYAAVIAQAIYGEDFDVSISDKSKVATIINQTEKMKQRYNMSMYAADHSFAAAAFAGIAWKDNTVKQGEKYLYRIISKIPKEINSMDTALVYVGLSDYEALPKPSDILPEFGDKTVLLKWDFESFKEYYTSYQLERSDDDGKTFHALSDKPVTALNNKTSGSATGSIFYLDTLNDNKTAYQYRVAGVSLFGEISPYSNIIKGRGKSMLPLTPNITGVTQNNQGTYTLNWEFQDSLNNLVHEFRINHSDVLEGEYSIFQKNINPQIRSIQIDSLSESGYFTVTVVSKDGEERTSLPYLLQPEDSIAPVAPSALATSIDSNGIVKITWKPNEEKDLAGYKVFRTADKGNELVAVFDSLSNQNYFTDTLNLKSLNRKMYYTVTAVDRRYNQSAFAPLTEVTKPDIIPPTQPVLSGYEVTDRGVNIKWINSSDEDVATYNIYRKNLKENKSVWKLIATVNNKSVNEIADTSYEKDNTYSYTIIAVDNSKLESAPAPPLTIYIPGERTKNAVKQLQLAADRKNRLISIEWMKDDNTSNIRQFQLYKGEDKLVMSLYKQFPSDTSRFTDKELSINTKYKYAVRAVYTNGSYSDFISKNIIY